MVAPLSFGRGLGHSGDAGWSAAETGCFGVSPRTYGAGLGGKERVPEACGVLGRIPGWSQPVAMGYWGSPNGDYHCLYPIRLAFRAVEW